MVGNCIFSLDCKFVGILGVIFDKRVFESKGMIGNRIFSVIGGGYFFVFYQNIGFSSGGILIKFVFVVVCDVSFVGFVFGFVDFSVVFVIVDSLVLFIILCLFIFFSLFGIVGIVVIGNVFFSFVVVIFFFLNVNFGIFILLFICVEVGDVVFEFLLLILFILMGNSIFFFFVLEYDFVVFNFKFVMGFIFCLMMFGIFF